SVKSSLVSPSGGPRLSPVKWLDMVFSFHDFISASQPGPQPSAFEMKRISANWMLEIAFGSSDLTILFPRDT
ncbi:MAG: hypothetical protein WB554_16730, partial [Desulfomonilaceae bacterium]